MDEYQLQVCPSLITLVKGTEDNPPQPKPQGQERWADPSHVGEEVWLGYSPVGERMSQSIAIAAEYYGMRVPFDGDYQIGLTWKDCH